MPPFGLPPQIRVSDEGSLLPLRSQLDFTGSGVTASDISGRTAVTIAAGSGSGGVTVYNVKTTYGAAGNGSTDDTTAIQNALTACYNAGGGIVYLPSGLYRTTATLQIKSDTWLMGDGYGNTIISCDANATYDVIKVGDGTTLGNGRFCKITDIEVDAGANKTAGAQVHFASSYCSKMKDCYLNGGYDGVKIDGDLTTMTEVTNSVITAFSHHGVIFRVPNNGGQLLRDCLIGGHISTGAGILWAQRDAIFIEHTFVLDSPVLGGLRIEGDASYTENTSTGSGVGHISNSHFDAGDGPGVYVNKNGMRFGMIEFHDCYAGYNIGPGLHIVDVDSLSWIGGKIINNGTLAFGTAYSGIQIDGGTSIQINGATITKNYDAGIRLASGVSGVRIVNNRITQTDLGYGGLFSGTTQATGIVYGGSNTNCVIVGNDLRGNGTAATSGTAPTSSQIGYNL